MIKKLNTLIKDDRGQALVLVALSMVVIIGVAALAVDYGYLAWQKRDLQNAADSAALAAAWELPNGSYEVLADEYVRKYIDIEGITTTPTTNPEGSIVREFTDNDGIPTTITTTKLDEKTVRVEIDRTYSLMLARVLGIDNSDVYAMAEAEKDSWYTGLLPFGLRDDYIDDDDPIDKSDPDYPLDNPDYPLNFDLDDYVKFMEDKITTRINLWGKEDDENLKFGLVKLGEFSYPHKENTSPKDVIEAGLDKSIYGEDLYIGSGLDSSIEDSLIGKNNPKPEDYPGFFNLSGGEGYIIGVLPSRAALLENSTNNDVIYWEEYVILHFEGLIYDKKGDVYLSGILKDVYNISDPTFNWDDFDLGFVEGRSSILTQ